jgi:hypothetical protein
MLRMILAATLFGAVLPGVSIAQQANAPVELGDFGGRLRSVRLVVNGQEGLFTVDTGGGVSLISPEFARRIGCTPWAAHTGFRLTGERLDMPRCEGVAFTLPGGTRLRPVAPGVIDLKPLLFDGAPPLDGSIALEAFEGRAFTLDLGNGTLELETPASLAARTAGAREVPIRLVRQAGGQALGVAVPVTTAKGTLWMTLDSGGGAPVLVRDKVAAELGLDAAGKTPQPFTLAVAGDQAIAVPTRAIVRDMILDGVIGMAVLVRWRMTFDLAHNRLWIAPARR